MSFALSVDRKRGTAQCSVKRNVERIKKVARDINSPRLAHAFHVRFTLRKKGQEKSDSFHFISIYAYVSGQPKLEQCSHFRS